MPVATEAGIQKKRSALAVNYVPKKKTKQVRKQVHKHNFSFMYPVLFVISFRMARETYPLQKAWNSRFLNLYINLACLSFCLFVCLYPINVKTAKPIGPKFFVGPRSCPQGRFMKEQNS